MMNDTQHLLVILAEEGGEIVQDVAKALRFGLHDIEPGTAEDNLRRIEREVAEMLGLTIREEDKIAKRAKVLKYMEYSRSIGMLEKVG